VGCLVLPQRQGVSRPDWVSDAAWRWRMGSGTGTDRRTPAFPHDFGMILAL
jgi:hypothetical protein